MSDQTPTSIIKSAHTDSHHVSHGLFADLCLECPATDDQRERKAEWARSASLDEMIDYSFALLRRVQDGVRRTHRLTGTLGLFSGGNDSTTFMHLMRGEFDKAVHINTGIGIAETRQYVRDCCAGYAS